MSSLFRISMSRGFLVRRLIESRFRKMVCVAGLLHAWPSSVATVLHNRLQIPVIFR